LLEWYSVNRRTLPWRGADDPYAILVAEFMLQQTGVERVQPIYLAFLRQFPTFQALANAPRLDVLRAWGGLGYNRRAVHLQECAQRVVAEHGGILPRDLAELRRLPGVGPYTAAAILSFVFHDDVATVDTNIRRVVGRLFFPSGAREAYLQRAATDLIPPGRSSDVNQALMDFGSIQCTAVNPPCLLCPLLDACASGPLAPAPASSRKVAERAEPYLGSRRFLRGRIVAVVRSMDPGALVPLSDVATAIGLRPDSPADRQTADLARQLSAEGLARLVEDAGQLLVGPPI
jgi:A/G-specific adenine glycosylase